MYSRSYYDKAEEFALPANYDGTAFVEDKKNEENSTRPPSECQNELKRAEQAEAQCSASEAVSFPGLGALSRLGGGLFGGLFGKGGLKLPKLGAEEILIIATALFLLFSKDGDIECSILLLLLLLIN